MNPATPEDPVIKYYHSRQSAGVWSALVVTLSVITVGSSLAVHSFRLTAGLLFGAIATWYVGYWVLSKNLYFVSSTTAGYRDAFNARSVQFDDVQFAIVSIGGYHRSLIFVCGEEKVTMPLDPMEKPWLEDVKAELAKRGITVTTTVREFNRRNEHPEKN